MIFSITNPTELVDWLQIFCKSGWLSPWDPPLQWRKNPRKNLPPRNTPDSFCRRFTPTKSIAALLGRYFSLWETYLENFISRPDVIPTFRQRRCKTGAGTSFGANGDQHTRAVELSTYFCVLTIRKQLPRNSFERSGRGQEPSRGHKFSILENVVLHRDFTSQTLANFLSVLLGRACPKPCRVTIKFIIVPWTEYNTSFDDTLLLFLQKSNYLWWPVVRCNYFMSFHQSLDLVWKNTEHMIQ